jgi:hypothetical protein
MPIDRVVINASPLITLFRAGLHPLLPKPFFGVAGARGSVGRGGQQNL